MTREEAIEVIKLAMAQVEWDYPMDYAAAFDMAIKALEQEPKTGHWITETAKHNRHLGSRNGYCSVCKNFYTDDWDIMNFCPNCGAKMAESEE